MSNKLKTAAAALDNHKPYRASVAINKPEESATEDDPFDYLERDFDDAIAARLWASRKSRRHPMSVGSAVVSRLTWGNCEGHWVLLDRDVVWEM